MMPQRHIVHCLDQASAPLLAFEPTAGDPLLVFALIGGPLMGQSSFSPSRCHTGPLVLAHHTHGGR
jgi:hypothetical protein